MSEDNSCLRLRDHCGLPSLHKQRIMLLLNLVFRVRRLFEGGSRASLRFRGFTNSLETGLRLHFGDLRRASS